MKWKISALVVLILFTSVGSYSEVDSPVPALAVARFENLTGKVEYANLEELIPNFLVTELAGDKRIKVVERQRLEKLINEYKFQLTGLVEPGTVEKIGHLLNIDYLLLGAISLSGGNFRVDVHLLDVKTGQIVAARKAYATDFNQLSIICSFLSRKIVGALVPQEPEKPSTSKPPLTEKCLTLAVEPSNPFFIPGKQNNVYLRLGLIAGQKKIVKKRVPLNIALVIDRSGSMGSQNKLEYVKKAAICAIDNLTKDDIISIVAYDNAVNIPYPASTVTNKDVVKKSVEQLVPGGSTNLSGGMEEGYKQVYKDYAKERINRVILLSDGLANVGETRPEVLKANARKHSDEGVTLTAMGVGRDYNEELMLGLAEYGGGNYYFIDAAEKTLDIFDHEFKGLLNVVARKIRIELIPTSRAEIVKVYGYETRRDGRNIYLAISNMAELERRNIIVEFAPLPTKDRIMPLAKINLEYENPEQPGYTISQSSNIALAPTVDKKVWKEALNENVQKEVELAIASEALSEVSKLIREGKNEEAKRLLGTQTNQIIRASNVLRDEALQEKAVTFMQTYSQLDNRLDAKKSAEQKALFDSIGGTGGKVVSGKVRRKAEIASKELESFGYANIKGQATKVITTEVNKAKLEDYLKDGLKFYQQNKIDEALVNWGNVLVIDPDNEMVKNYIRQTRKKSPKQLE